MYTRGNIHIHLGNSGMYPGYPLTTLTGAKKIPLTLAGNTKAIPVCSGIEIPIDIHIIIPAGIIFSAHNTRTYGYSAAISANGVIKVRYFA